MNNKFKILFACIGFSSFVFAQESVTLNIEKALELAIQNNKSIKSADIDLEIKKRTSDTSWNVFSPLIQLNGTLSRQNDIESNIKSANSTIALSNALSPFSGQPVLPLIEETESMHWNAIGTFSIGLNFSAAYIVQIQNAKIQYEAGKISYEQQIQEIMLSVKKLFYALLLQQENLNIKKNSLENARQRANQSEINFKNGLVPELAMLNAQVSYENQKPETAQAEMALNRQFDTFAFLLGLPIGTKINLDGHIEPEYIEADTEKLLEKYSEYSLELKLLEANIKKLKLSLEMLNFSTYTPALAINWSLQPLLTDAFANSWANSDNWKDNGNLNFTLAWNLSNMLPWSQNIQQAKDLKANIEKCMLSMEILKENQKIEVRKYVDTLIEARQQIEAMTRNISLAQRSYDMSAVSYRNGSTELLDLKDAEAQLNKAKLGLASQKFNYISTVFDLEKTLNTKLTSNFKDN